MKTIALSAGFLAVVSLGWFGIAALKATPAMAAGMQPIVHPAFDSGRINEEIALHEGRVKRDPKGALGWSMLSAAYLAKSREFDSDVSAWSAEAAARKSLSLRQKNNSSAARRLVQSLLEQHRFQDALATIDRYASVDPADSGFTHLKIDVLIEVGRVAEASHLLKTLAADDTGRPVLEARVASANGDHKRAESLLWEALATMEANCDVRSEDLAWFRVKIGNELRAQGKLDKAREEYELALTLHPRNYKALLGIAHVLAEQARFTEVAEWAGKVFEVTDSMEAKVLLAESKMKQGDRAAFEIWKDKVVDQFETEDAKFQKFHKGGPLHVRPEDRTFATFCASQKLEYPAALIAAKRDYANRPDTLAKANLAALSVSKNNV